MAKLKIPKRVAGVKIPKKVRRKARKAVKMAESPMVREFATAALGAAAARAKGARAGSREARAAANAARAGANAARAGAKGARAAAEAARAEAEATRLAVAAETGGSRFEHEAVIEIDGERLVQTIRAAALNGLRSFIEGLEEGLRDLDAAATEAESRSRRRANGSPSDAADA